MSEDPIQAYQEAIRNLESGTMRVEKLIDGIIEIAKKLQDWKHVTVSDGKTGFPAEAMGHSINLGDWPSPQQLTGSLSGWHKTRQAANNAWHAIPRERRTSLQPPPEY